MAHATRDFPSDAAAETSALLVKALLLEAVREAGHPDSPAGIERHHREAIARTVAFIREQPEANTPVQDLARRAGYSLDHYSRIFHQVTGETPKDYMIRARLERAATLLRESSQTIGQIADALGYRDAGFFSRQFKQKLGFSPARFRCRGND